MSSKKDFSPPFVCSIDTGTSSSRAIVFDSIGRIVSNSQKQLDVSCPQPGWAEMDPHEILKSIRTCVEESVSIAVKEEGISISDIRGIGITNQRETTIMWDKTTGEPLAPAIVWLDGRTSSTVTDLTRRCGGDRFKFQSICGLPLSTYFSAVKIHWLMNHTESVRKCVDDGKALFGTVDTWVIWNLTQSYSHVTDVTNASRTMLMNLDTLSWDDSMLSFFNIPKSILPDIRSSAEVYGVMKDGLLKGVPICSDLGDQQAALVGQLCFKQGEVKSTYGTGCFMLFNTGNAPIFSKHGLLTTVGYKIGDKACYALEGSIAVAGAAVKWARDNMKLINSAKHLDELAASVSDSGDVYFVPAFAGLLAPHWKDDARGFVEGVLGLVWFFVLIPIFRSVLVGISQYTRQEHFARAILESSAYQTREVVDAMAKDSKVPLSSIRVDGGMTNSKPLLQILADTLDVSVVRPEMLETTAYGAALAAGVGAGLWTLDEAVNRSKLREEFVFLLCLFAIQFFLTVINICRIFVYSPKMDSQARGKNFTKWQKAVSRSLGWMSSDEDVV